MSHSLSTLNTLSQADFTAALGKIFEATPAIAHHTWRDRPFSDIDHLHRSMVAVVEAMSPEEQLALICAHPDLGSKAKMADASVQEQTGAGLTQLTPAEYDRFQNLNQQYKTQFGFPFILAVKGHTKASILEAFEQRLQHSPEIERQQALTEICKIARFRLQEHVIP